MNEKQKPSTSPELSRYRFIPPSKLLKTRQQQQSKRSQPCLDGSSQNSSPLPLEYSLNPNSFHFTHTDHQLYPPHLRQSDHFTHENFPKQQQDRVKKRKTTIITHHSSCQLIKSSSLVGKSSSKGKLGSAALKPSQKPFLKKKISTNKQNLSPKVCNAANHSDKLLISKLQNYIQELKQKELLYIEQIKSSKRQLMQVTEENEDLSNQLLSVNKRCQQLKRHLKKEENRSGDKCREHQLIIQSLKRVISGQMGKIQRLQNYSCSSDKQNYSDRLAGKSSVKDTESLPTSEIRQSSQYDLQNPPIGKIRNYEAVGYPESNFLHNSERPKVMTIATTPDFGPCTPNDTIKEITQEEQSEESQVNYRKYLSLDRELSQDQGYSEKQSAKNIFIMDSQQQEQTKTASVFSKRRLKSEENQCSVADLPDYKSGNMKIIKLNDEGEQLLREVDRYLAGWKNK